MGQQHKHAEVIKAWADGAEIEYRTDVGMEWTKVFAPHFDGQFEFRIKPDPRAARDMAIAKAVRKESGAQSFLDDYDLASIIANVKD